MATMPSAPRSTGQGRPGGSGAALSVNEDELCDVAERGAFCVTISSESHSEPECAQEGTGETSGARDTRARSSHSPDMRQRMGPTLLRWWREVKVPTYRKVGGADAGCGTSPIEAAHLVHRRLQEVARQCEVRDQPIALVANLVSGS